MNKELREVGLKVTAPRIKILEIMSSATTHHMSAEEIYKALIEAGEDVGLATVYRVMAQFESAGLVRRHNFEGDSAVFEIDQGKHHDHLVCQVCGRIEEFHDERIEQLQEELCKRRGFTMTSHDLRLFGICRRCK